ncbi:MAG: membrane protein insertase YidC [Magnetococcales bacterium]|nr:membrane protein insertase YidC [Magnetococcales bacterium]NGZ28684.1 membrane protein insertase YidC [Magnetococcales bacterium]
MEQRTTLALILSFLVIMLYQVYLSVFFPPEEEAAVEQTQSSTINQAAPGGNPPSLANAPASPAAPVAAPVAAPAGPPVTPKNENSKVVTFANGVVEGKVNTLGGRLTGLRFLQYKDHLGADGKPVVFMQEAGENFFVGESGFISLPGIVVPNRETLWQQADFQGKDGENGIRLVWDNKAGLTFEKSFVVAKGSYLITVRDRVVNTASQPTPLYRFQQLLRIPPKVEGDMYDFQGPTAFLDDNRLQLPYDDIKAKEVSQNAKKGWAGFSDKYFLAAMIPHSDGQISYKYYFDYDAPTHRIGAVSQQIAVAANGQYESVEQWYIGPKALEILESLKLGLERSIDYGWFHFLAVPLMELLLFFYSIIGNYGVAITLLTLVVKVLFFPLADKSYRSMEEMKQLQPKVEELRKNYGHDKQLMNQEMMRLYQENKVNPLGGCLPMLIQIPVFFALYKILYLSIEMRHAPLAGWIQDLSEMDPYYILPLVMGVSMYYQTKLNPTPADPVQAKVMQFLPIVFTFMFLTFPSGLVLYWLVNNILSIAQQLHIHKKYKKA